MPELTTDPNDPRLGRGCDSGPVPQNAAYLVLPEEERAKGYVRPLRLTYKHVGVRPVYPLRELTSEEKMRFAGYAAYEAYPEGSRLRVGSVTGRYWTQAQLASGCGKATRMSHAIAETYARNPKFYSGTYCAHCQMHLPVAEFVWEGTTDVVGS